MDSAAAWVEALRAGDQHAFTLLYQSYAPSLKRYLLRHLADAQEAEDLVQDIFLSIWSRRATWRITTSVRAYLFTAARNRAHSQFDRRRVRRAWAARMQGLVPKAVDAPVEARLFGEDLHVAISHWLSELPPRRREIFELSRHAHLTYPEIADVLGISIKTVETQMSRALRHLRKRLAHYEAAGTRAAAPSRPAFKPSFVAQAS